MHIYSQCSCVVPVDDLRAELKGLGVKNKYISTLRTNVEVSAVLGETACCNGLAAVCVCVCVCACINTLEVILQWRVL